MGRSASWRGALLAGWLLAAMAGAPGRLAAQTLARRGWVGSGMTVEGWWEHALFYQVDPLSFQDSDGDGFGDLRGLAGRLDYVQSLGVDALVLSPFALQGEPGAEVRPAGAGLAGTYANEDFDRLLAEAGRRRIRVMVDLPLGPAHGPGETAAAARFWLTRGVAGLRLVRDRTDTGSGGSALGARELGARVAAVRAVAAGFPGLRVVLVDLGDAEAEASSTRGTVRRRRHGDGRTSGSVGEEHELAPELRGLAPALIVRRGLEELGADRAGSPGIAGLGNVLRSLATGSASPERVQSVLATDGADRVRTGDRLGDGEHDAAIAKVLASALLLSRAGALVYFGQEIGMGTTPVTAGARDGGEPTPMQWGSLALEPPADWPASPNTVSPNTKEIPTLGFTSGTPWLSPGRNAATANVTAEDPDAGSLLGWYRRLASLHHAHEALRSGATEWLPTGDARAIAWVRRVTRGAEPAITVLANLSASPVTVFVGSGPVRVLARSDTAGEGAEGATVGLRGLTLPPYAVLIGQAAHAELATPVRRPR